MLDAKEQEIVQILWRDGRLSRWELHERSGQSPNGVGTVVGGLIKKGVLKECPAEPSGGGRPRVPLELDPVQKHVVGLMVTPGEVEICRLNLYGALIGKPINKEVPSGPRILTVAAKLIEEFVSDATLGIGMGVTGLVDAQAHEVLISSALPGQGAVSLQPVYEAAGAHPIVLANDMQALAARWMLTHRAELHHDVLLVGFSDGQLGAAMLIEGRPNHGCVMGSNELGHTRMPVETQRCYCGQLGCLERICSTPFLHSQGLDSTETLRSILAKEEEPPALHKMIELLAMGIANSVNFIRPHRLVLVSEMVRHGKFAQALTQKIRSMLLAELAERVRIDQWDQLAQRSAETAGWAVLANLYANMLTPTQHNGSVAAAG